MFISCSIYLVLGSTRVDSQIKAVLICFSLSFSACSPVNPRAETSRFCSLLPLSQLSPDSAPVRENI